MLTLLTISIRTNICSFANLATSSGHSSSFSTRTPNGLAAIGMRFHNPLSGLRLYLRPKLLRQNLSHPRYGCAFPLFHHFLHCTTRYDPGWR